MDKPAYITEATIRNFQGINECILDGMMPLTVLTGPTGSGKSSVLNALGCEYFHSAYLPDKKLKGGAEIAVRLSEGTLGLVCSIPLPDGRFGEGWRKWTQVREKVEQELQGEAEYFGEYLPEGVARYVSMWKGLDVVGQGGIAFTDNPDSGMDERLIELLAREVLTAVLEQGTQVILATHSSAMIDSLFRDERPEDITEKGCLICLKGPSEPGGATTAAMFTADEVSSGSWFGR